MADKSEDTRSRTEQLRAMSRKLLMEFADEDDWIDKPTAAMAKPEHGARDALGRRRETLR
jgi:hypothetical protein